MESTVMTKIRRSCRCMLSKLRSGYCNEDGFTIIEMLVVSIILAVAILGMESLQIYAIGQIQRGDDSSTAAAIALDVSEMLRTRDPATLVTVPEGSANELVFNDEAFANNGITLDAKIIQNRGSNQYYVSWTVRNGPIGERIVDVQVRWYTAGYDPAIDPNIGVKRYVTTTIIS